MRQVYEKVKNIVINPWYAMFFMLIISYFSLCRYAMEVLRNDMF